MSRRTLDKLEQYAIHLSVPERLSIALQRLQELKVQGFRQIEGSTKKLWTEQVGVMEDFYSCLEDLVLAYAIDPTIVSSDIWSRIVFPPRTGKTILAGQMIIASGLTTVFIVPTLVLAKHAEREMKLMLPNIPVGIFTGEAKSVVMYGVNITTYQCLWSWHNLGLKLPLAIRLAGLIFCDEGHKTMTRRRQKMLREIFDPWAMRVALTATPDYKHEDRRLALYFPRLIHEMTPQEAVGLGLLARARMWVVEVDRDASEVRLRAGDYDSQHLARIMSDAPFFQAALHYRYLVERDEQGEIIIDNRSRSALLCCATRNQALALQAYLALNRPIGTPRPEVIIHGLSGSERDRILEEYEAGLIDTLITVDVLREGWSAVRCKLLITLDLTVSPVRAMQTYFRVLTRWEDAVAHFFILIPRDLPYVPLLPTDFLSSESEEYECGRFLGLSERSGKNGSIHITP